MSSRCAGGFDFIAGDDGALTSEQIVWSEHASPRVLRATRLTDPDAPKPPAVILPDGDIYRATDTGRAHSRWLSDGAHDLVVNDDDAEAGINAIALPLDDAFELRLDAARRFWRAMKGRHPAPAYGTLPRQTKARHVLNLRAHDGRRAGATQRQIAEALFRDAPIASRDWRDHPHRHKVRAILRRAGRLVAGGYRDLLFYPGTAPR